MGSADCGKTKESFSFRMHVPVFGSRCRIMAAYDPGALSGGAGSTQEDGQPEVTLTCTSWDWRQAGKSGMNSQQETRSAPAESRQRIPRYLDLTRTFPQERLAKTAAFFTCSPAHTVNKPGPSTPKPEPYLQLEVKEKTENKQWQREMEETQREQKRQNFS